MKRYKIDGNKVKVSRKNRDRRSTQKEFAYEIRVSERKLRDIENSEGDIDSEVLDRLAKACEVSRDTLLELVPHTGVSAVGSAPTPRTPTPPTLVPRWDTAHARVQHDEGELFKLMRQSKKLIPFIKVKLTAETDAYAMDLFVILQKLTQSDSNYVEKIDGQTELAIRRRVRELLVLLKGNDVWLYTDHLPKLLPERFEIAPEGEKLEIEWQALLCLGPPGEYREDTVELRVDNGQPYLIDWEKKIKF